MEQSNSNHGSSVPTRMKTRYLERKKEQDAKEAEKKKEESKKRKTLFKRRSNVIGKNAIIVNPKVSKIKLESDVVNDATIVKEEHIPLDNIGGNGSVTEECKDEKIVVHELDIPVSDHEEILEKGEKYTSYEYNVFSEMEAVTVEKAQTNPLQDWEIVTIKKQLALRNMKIKELTNKVKNLQDQLASSNATLEKADNELKDLRNSNASDSNKFAQAQEKLNKVYHSAASENVQMTKTTHFLNEENIPSDLRVERYQMAFEILIKHGSTNGDILWSEKNRILKRFRLICKAWKRAVDNLFEDDRFLLSLCPTHLDLEWFREKYSPRPLKFLCSGPSKYAQKLLVHHRKGKLSPSHNPCVSRHILIEIDTRCHRWNYFARDILEYLRIFGGHIWNLTIATSPYKRNYDFDVKRIEQQTIYDLHEKMSIKKFVCECVSRVQNVKSLTIDISSFDKYKGKPSKYWDDVCPLEKLNALTTVHFGRNNKLNYKIIKNSQETIQNLYLGLEHDQNNEAYFKIMELEFRNLSQVTCRIESIERLEKFMTATWNLTKLTLSFHNGKSYEFNNVLEMLSRFKNSLEYLTLDFKQAVVQNIEDPIPMKLTMLNYLHIIFPRQRSVSWDHAFENLKKLETFKLEHVLCTLPRSGNSTIGKSFWKYVGDFVSQTGSWEWKNCVNLKEMQLIVDFRQDNTGRKKVVDRKQIWIKGCNQKMVKLDYQQVKMLKVTAFGGIMRPYVLKGWGGYEDSDSDPASQ